MAVIVKKDVGVGVNAENAYVKIYISYEMKRRRYQVQHYVYMGKQSRELEWIQQWLSYRYGSVTNPIPYDPEYGLTVGVTNEAQWHDMYDKGPWDSAADMDLLISRYMQIATRPIQEYSHFYYVDEDSSLPKVFNVDNAVNGFYALLKNPNSRIFSGLESQNIPRQDIVNSIKDDLETKEEVIVRYGATDPLLLSVAAGENIQDKLDAFNAILSQAGINDDDNIVA